ncbi:bro protein [Neophasia sp. alphabaculovirus]|nr:bro protein [Neophasia sp. alphabaculovirus]
MLANPFARVLDYVSAPNAVAKFVSEQNQTTYEKIKSHQIGETSTLVQPKSKFINSAGLFELIQASRMPKAQQFKQWINTDLLPKLCDEGNYDMAVDAPAEIVEGMNAVHAVINNGQQAPWMADLKFYKKTIVEKDEKILLDLTCVIIKNEKLKLFKHFLFNFHKIFLQYNRNNPRQCPMRYCNTTSQITHSFVYLSLRENEVYQLAIVYHYKFLCIAFQNF